MSISHDAVFVVVRDKAQLASARKTYLDQGFTEAQVQIFDDLIVDSTAVGGTFSKDKGAAVAVYIKTA